MDDGRQHSSRSGRRSKDGADRHEAQRMIALLRCTVDQQTELTYDDDVLPQHRQRCALPGVRG
jgi:hypothetical protein